MKKIFYSAVLFFLLDNASAQLITTIPVFPTTDDSVTIIYDASLGNAALAGIATPVYAHTGVITNLSTSPTDWKHVQGTWGTTGDSILMTEIGTDMYQLKYNIRDYYSVPVTETVYQMAFVFRNADGSIVGRNADGTDIYADVYEPGLHAKILSPTASPYIVEAGEIVHIAAASSQSDSLLLYVNDVLVSSTTDTSLEYDYTTIVYGTNNIIAKAKNASDATSDTATVFVRPPVTVAELPAGMQDGINYLNDSTITLVLFAPDKNYVFAIGDYSNWDVTENNYMNVTPDGNTYWLTLNNLVAGKEYAYQYLIDGTSRFADAFAEKILDPYNDSYISDAVYPDLKPYPTGKTSGIVSVFQTAQPEYIWNIPDFIPAPNTDLVIYELLIRDFTSARDFNTLRDTLNYLKQLGINAIELMPVNEFEGNSSWGYNPDFFMAVDKAYGTSVAYKELIDSIHANGMAVIMDIAMNHAFGQCPLVQMWWDAALNVPALNNPYFNQYPTHDYNVGYDFNHESPATKKLTFRIFKYWLQKYNVDGYRFDLSKGYTQNNTVGDVGAWGAYDANRIATWKEIADTLRSVRNDAILILEHFADNSEETVLSDYGFLLWGNLNYNYNQATMGYGGSDLSWGSYQNRGWSNPNLVTYMESHDQERLMYKNLQYGNSSGGYDCSELNTALLRMEQAAAFFFTIPGPKMIWQFGELGYDYSKSYNGDLGEKPIRWDYLTVPERYRLYQIYSALINLKKQYDVFRTTNYNLSVLGEIKRINLNNADMNVTVLGNFQVTSGSVTPAFQHTGWWYEYFTGDSINVTDVNASISLAPGAYRLYTDNRLTTPDIISSTEQISGHIDNISVYPNPSVNNFTIQYTAHTNANVQFEIVNNTGEVIYTENLDITPGAKTIYWNAKNNAGEKSAAGIYYARIISGDSVQTIRLIVF